MYNLTDRQLSILYLLLDKKTWVTSKQLADFSASSVRTIKSEITKVNEILMKENLMHIDAVTGQGYKLEKRAQIDFTDFENRIKSEYSFYKKYGVVKMSRRLHIMQRLLSSESVKIDDIADELYVSKSAIKHDMRWVGEFLASYGIQIVSRPIVGSCLIGDEKDIRVAMVETFCSQYYFIQSNYNVQAFHDEFYVDYKYYEKIRLALLEILRDSKYSMREISTKKISTYVVLIRRRIKDGKYVQISQKEKIELKDSYELQVAKLIVKIPCLYEHIAIYEDEIYYLAILLICYRDVDLMDKNDQETIHKQFLGETVKRYERIANKLQSDQYSLFFKMELFNRFRIHLLSTLYSLYVCAKYHQNGFQHLSTYFEIADYEFSPYGTELARQFLMITEKVFQTTVTHDYIDRYIILFELILKRINLDYKKRRIAIVSLAGRSVAREYKEFILDQFHDFVDYIDVFNQYEMSRICFENYDITFVDGLKFDNVYPIDFVTYRILSSEIANLQIFESAFIKGYSTEMLNYLKEITKIHHNFECSSFFILFKMLSFKYGGENTSVYEEMLNRKEQMYSFYNARSMVALIMCDYEMSQCAFVDIYVSNHKMLWNRNNEVKCIISVSLPDDLSMVQMKTINMILHVLYSNLKVCKDLCVDMKYTYQSIFKDIIRSNFLRK